VLVLVLVLVLVVVLVLQLLALATVHYFGDDRVLLSFLFYPWPTTASHVRGPQQRRVAHSHAKWL
jgi:hypothetical protein